MDYQLFNLLKLRITCQEQLNYGLYVELIASGKLATTMLCVLFLPGGYNAVSKVFCC